MKLQKAPMGGKVRVENLTISKESKSNSGTDQIRSDFPGMWELREDMGGDGVPRRMR